MGPGSGYYRRIRVRIDGLTAFARRTGADWFVGILNTGEAENYPLDLSFRSSGPYQVTLVQDDPSADQVNLVGFNAKANLHEFTAATPFAVSKKTVQPGGIIPVPLAPNGGFVARFTPIHP